MSKFIHNIRCLECNSLYTKNDTLQASFYNGFESYICKNCGCSGCFFDSSEKWISEAVWCKPWTWWQGKWVGNGTED